MSYSIQQSQQREQKQPATPTATSVVAAVAATAEEEEDDEAAPSTAVTSTSTSSSSSISATATAKCKRHEKHQCQRLRQQQQQKPRQQQRQRQRCRLRCVSDLILFSILIVILPKTLVNSLPHAKDATNSASTNATTSPSTSTSASASASPSMNSTTNSNSASSAMANLAQQHKETLMTFAYTVGGDGAGGVGGVGGVGGHQQQEHGHHLSQQQQQQHHHQQQRQPKPNQQRVKRLERRRRGVGVIGGVGGVSGGVVGSSEENGFLTALAPFSSLDLYGESVLDGDVKYHDGNNNKRNAAVSSAAASDELLLPQPPDRAETNGPTGVGSGYRIMGVGVLGNSNSNNNNNATSTSGVVGVGVAAAGVGGATGAAVSIGAGDYGDTQRPAGTLLDEFVSGKLSTADANGNTLPIFLTEPESVFVVKNRPAVLKCKAAHALQLHFKCSGSSQPPPSLHDKHVDPHTGVHLEEVTATIHRDLVDEYFGKGPFKCECQAWSSRGVVKSQAATINIAYMRKQFTTSPTSLRVEVGSRAELFCVPPNAFPEPKISWQKNNVPIGATNGIADGHIGMAITPSGTLTFQQVTLQDMANYTCSAENVAGKRTSESAVLIVYVNGGWSSWSPWRECKCAGKPSQGRKRTRACTNPMPLNGGAQCTGPQIQKSQDCISCPEDTQIISTDGFDISTNNKRPVGRWSSWGEWSSCSSDCIQIRRRKCITNAVDDVVLVGGGTNININNNNNNNNNNGGVGGSGSSSGDVSDDDGINSAALIGGMGGAGGSSIVGNLVNIPGIGSNGNGANIGLSGIGIGVGVGVGGVGIGGSGGSSSGVGGGGTGSGISLSNVNGGISGGGGGGGYGKSLCSGKDIQTAECRGEHCHIGKDDFDWTLYLGLAFVTAVCFAFGAALICCARRGIGANPHYNMARTVMDSEYLPGSDKKEMRMHIEAVSYDYANPGHRYMHNDLVGCGVSEHHYDVPNLSANYTNPIDELSVDYRTDTPDTSTADTSNSTYDIAAKTSSLSVAKNTVGETLHGPGGNLRLYGGHIMLYIPELAIGKGVKKHITLTLLGDDSTRISFAGAAADSLITCSTTVHCTPRNYTFHKPVILKIPHCLAEPELWSVNIFHADNEPDDLNVAWRRLVIVGEETINSPVFVQLEPTHVYIMTEQLGRFVVVAEPRLSASVPSLKMKLIAFSQLTPSSINCSLRIYVVKDFPNSRDICTAIEAQLGGSYMGESECFAFRLNNASLNIRVCHNDLDAGVDDDDGASWGELEQVIPYNHILSSNTILHCEFSIKRSSVLPLALEVQFAQWQYESGIASDWHSFMLPGVGVSTPQTSLERCRTSTTVSIDRQGNCVNDATSVLCNVQLPRVTKRRICAALDPPRADERDWRLLAHKLNSDRYIAYFATKPSPTEQILNLWETRASSSATIVQLLLTLKEMERDDVMQIITETIGPLWL